MSEKKFNAFIGTCESCRRMIFENSKRYWVRFGGEGHCFCEKCVTVIEPKKNASLCDECERNCTMCGERMEKEDDQQ